MSTWWKKITGALAGEPLGPPDDDAAPAPRGDAPAARPMDEPEPSIASGPSDTSAGISERVDDPSETVRHPIQDTTVGLDEVLGRLDPLVETMERHAADQSGQAERILSRLDGFTTAIEAVRDAGRLQEGKLAELVDSTAGTQEHVQRVREIVASLPEIAAVQADAVAHVDQRLAGLEERTAALTDAAAGHDRAVAELRECVVGVDRAVGDLREIQTDLATRQREIAESLNGLCERTTQTIQLFKENAEKLRQLAEAPQAGYRQMSEQVRAECHRLADLCGGLQAGIDRASSRSMVAIILAAIAAVGAVAAAVGVFLRSG